MTGPTIPAAAGLAGRRRTPWAAILLRVGLLLALLGLLAAAGQLLGPWSPDRLRQLLAALGPFPPVAYVGLFLVLNTAGVPAPLLGAAGGLALGLVPGALAGMTVAACGQLLLGRRLTGPPWPRFAFLEPTASAGPCRAVAGWPWPRCAWSRGPSLRSTWRPG